MRHVLRNLTFILCAFLWTPASAAAQVERLCDPGREDCRQILINYIRAEHVGLDVAFWFMEDSWIASEVIARHRAGVPVRVLMDTQANASNWRNVDRLAELRAAGIPMRERTASGILHWKMMLFAGQGIVEFSGANFSSDAWVFTGSPLTNYVDEAIYFTGDPTVVNSFRTKFDDLWTNTINYTNYANVTTLFRRYDRFPIDPELNFVPGESFADRSVMHYNAETQRIDVIIYRITDQRHTNAIIAARQRGIPVRLLTEPQQYRDANRLWHSWNIDRLYMAGVQIRNRAHAGLNHQKLTLLYSQGMSVMGSSNWTSPSSDYQEEHNYFTRKSGLFSWLADHFNRKWTNSAGVAESAPFTPLPPDPATTPTPAHGTLDVPTTGAALRWYAGFWAHNYDVYLGTTPDPPLFAANQMLGPSQSAADYKQYVVPVSLNPGTTYYWRIVSKTMANQAASSPVWSFTTTGSGAPPPPPPSGGGDIVLHAGRAVVQGAGTWRIENDSTAASGVKVRQPDGGAAKLTTASASPANYFDMSFTAEAGRPYRLWIRGRADANHYANDSTFVQFSGSVTSSGSPIWRIGTTSATEVSLEECSGCGVSNWGWQDNGWGSGVLGTPVYFATSGTQTIRIQQREDGLAIDQVVLSPATYFSSAPGATKNDSTILPEQGGSSGGTTPPPPPPPPSGDEIILWTADATTLAGGWRLVSDTSAAGGRRVHHPDAGAAKLTQALRSPAHYFEMTFNAVAGRAYRLWIRGKADNNYWANDSVFVQFDSSVTSSGSSTWRIGSSSAAEVNLEECNGCGVSNWGWQDNGWGSGVLGPLVYFNRTGTVRIRVQTREDGLSIDQIVLSPTSYLNTAPGANKNDSRILQKTQ